MSEIVLCRDCVNRVTFADPSDRSPCAVLPDRALAAARRECGGKLWVEKRRRTLGEAVELARGGPAPIRFRGFA